ncbi:MAG: hypothetical protein QF893_24505 [Alphaproteobacteria bacterium]|nr:hypothetical protein [Alphaproteobacteria bacterium]
MSEDQWISMTYLGLWLAVLLPAVIMHRRGGGRVWRDIALWSAIAGVALVAYLVLGPG